MDPQIERLFQRPRRETNEPRYEAFGNFAERFFLFPSSPLSSTPSPPPPRLSRSFSSSPTSSRRASPAPSLHPPFPPPRFPRSFSSSPLPAAAPVRARRQGKKPNAPRRFWRRGGSPHDLWGQSSSLWAAGSRKRRLPHGLGGARRLPWDGGLPLGARARASGGGARGAAKRDKKAPSFPHSGKNPPQNIAICAPVCYTMHATQFHR